MHKPSALATGELSPMAFQAGGHAPPLPPVTRQLTAPIATTRPFLGAIRLRLLRPTPPLAIGIHHPSAEPVEARHWRTQPPFDELRAGGAATQTGARLGLRGPRHV